MHTRRPRNIVSITTELALRCADFLDEGDTDKQAFDRLVAEFTGKLDPEKMKLLKKDSVKSFRNGLYKSIQTERLARRTAAQEANLLMADAQQQGAQFSTAGLDMMSKLMFSLLLKRGDAITDEERAGIVRDMVRVTNAQTAQIRALTDKERADLLKQVKSVASDKKLTAEQRAAKIDEAFGIRPKASAA